MLILPMCSSAPFSETPTTLPLIETLEYGLSWSKMEIATRWSRFRFLVRCLLLVVLRAIVSPSRSTQRGATWGEPSAISVATLAKFFPSMSSFALADNLISETGPSWVPVYGLLSGISSFPAWISGRPESEDSARGDFAAQASTFSLHLQELNVQSSQPRRSGYPPLAVGEGDIREDRQTEAVKPSGAVRKRW